MLLFPYLELALLALSHHAAAFSAGGGSGQTCDAIGVCSGGTCPDGMELVAPPTRSTAYSVRSGSASPLSDPTTYVPGSLVTIHVRVESQRIQQRKKGGELQVG